MRLKALSHYDGDTDTKFGDCILLYNNNTLIVYDCGHNKHSETVKSFLNSHPSISQVHIVISHNDADHTNGVIDLLDYLKDNNYSTSVYSSLYLKHTKKVMELLDDDRRTKSATKEHILENFDNIAEIVEKATDYSFAVIDATVNTTVASAKVVGPTEEEFVAVVAQAIKDDSVTLIEGETVMNAASVQLKCTLNDGEVILLCGDASPSYLHNLDSYDIIQLPHHGKLDDAKAIFADLGDSAYRKTFLVSDNTGSAANSGGSTKLKHYMQEEQYKAALNTRDGVVELPDDELNGRNGIATQRRTYYGDLGSI